MTYVIAEPCIDVMDRACVDESVQTSIHQQQVGMGLGQFGAGGQRRGDVGTGQQGRVVAAVAHRQRGVALGMGCLQAFELVGRRLPSVPVGDAEAGGHRGHATARVAAGHAGGDAVPAQPFEHVLRIGARLFVEMEGCDRTSCIGQQQCVGCRCRYRLAARGQREIGATEVQRAAIDLATEAAAGADLHRLRSPWQR